MAKMHSLVKIIALLVLLLLTSVMDAILIWLLCAMMCIIAVISGNGKFLITVKRMRWLWLSILFIYALNVPGEYMPSFPTWLAPTYEGVKLGLLQIAKLMIAIAGLHLLLHGSKKHEILSAFIQLLFPLKYLGLRVERFAARLFLTLEYVEELIDKPKIKMSFLQALHHNPAFLGGKSVDIHQRPLVLADKLALLAVLGLGATLIVLKTWQ